MIEFRDIDPLPIFKANPDRHDTSNFPTDHPLHSTEGKGKLGRMKFEYADQAPILEYVGLCAKMYSVKFVGSGAEEGSGEELRKIKGVPKSFVNNELRHQDYMAVLQHPHVKKGTFNIIRPRAHVLHTEQVTKITLRGRDDKRWLCADNISTHTYGHHRTLAAVEEEDDIAMEEL
jgi:hypothetical protein